MDSTPTSPPARAWVVTFAGTAINLCLGILYAWSVWNKSLVPRDEKLFGTAMTGANEGWHYLSNFQATLAYSICGFVFALVMIVGGRLQDRYGPKLGATAGGLFLAAGCILSGWMQSYLGLILGFGILGGIGMGLAYAATTPAAVKWFGPHRRGLIVGIVVGGYGGAAIYIAPLANWLIDGYGISQSFIVLGTFFAVVVVIAGQLLSWPPAGYIPPGRVGATVQNTPPPRADWPASAMLRTWQFYALVFLFLGSAQSGLLVIGFAAPILSSTAKDVEFFAANSWLLAAFGGFINATGRVGTGRYSDAIGRTNAYIINGLISAICLLATPYVMDTKNVWALFIVVGVAYWQYGGGLALLPAFTADFFGSKNLGFNYGLVFIGWGLAFGVVQIASYLRDQGILHYAFYLSGVLLIIAVGVCAKLRRPANFEA